MCVPEYPLGCRTWARLCLGTPSRAATQNCASAEVLAHTLGVATCARGHLRGRAGPRSSPPAGQGAGPTAPWALAGCWDVVGAVLILAVAALMGEAPGSGRGWNKEGKSQGRPTAEEEEEEEVPWNAEGPGE